MNLRNTSRAGESRQILVFEVLTKEHIEAAHAKELEQPEWLPLPRRLLKSERL